jgi:hypothetical protein
MCETKNLYELIMQVICVQWRTVVGSRKLKDFMVVICYVKYRSEKISLDPMLLKITCMPVFFSDF